jgi:phenylpropionate dioxygenase-like ring-hydroxylating dioxygenase large terminal subunit
LQAPLFKEIGSYMSGNGDRTRLAEQELRRSPSTYTSEAVHSAEKRMMLTMPVIVGHSSSLQDAGDFLANNDCGVPLLVVRQKDDSIKAFVNACRHRGARVCSGDKGSAKVFSCPYHGWTYNQDGTLRRVPRDGFPSVDVEQSGLVELPCEVRHGLIWVVPAPGEDIDVARFLGAVDEELGQYPLDGYVLERDATIKEGLNWKFVLDGFLEIYHIPFLHKHSIAPYFHGHSSPFDQFGRHSRLVGVKKSFDRLKDTPFDEVDDFLSHVAVNYQIFPNTVIVWQQDHFEVWSAFPGATPRDCTVRIMSLVTPEMSGEDLKRRWDSNWRVLIDTVKGEDWAISSEIQEALPYLPDDSLVLGRNEPGMQHFHAGVSAALAEIEGSPSAEGAQS